MSEPPSSIFQPDGGSNGPARDRSSRIRRTTQVIVVGSVMFTFISYWRTAAVVLCDLASTAYYIGGIVEQSIGKAAPWFILAVMVFSYAVRSVYIESCAMFVRGGVYKVVREAMGGFAGKLAVAALIFDYILTGPISSVTAGQYLASLGLEVLEKVGYPTPDKATADTMKNVAAVIFAIVVTLYFYRQNLLGIHESSDKAFKIMIATAVMAVLMMGWCGWTLVKDPDKRQLPPHEVNLEKKFETDPQTGEQRPRINKLTGQQEDPIGFLDRILPADAQAKLRRPAGVLTFFGLLGIAIAFGHSILSMSGYETLAQVYREVESPKLPNFKKAALVVFVFSVFLTVGISFMAVMIIPDDVRMSRYADNLIGGLAMYLWGPDWLKLLLNAFVVIVGSLILSGAVNTAIIGSNGVLNRVAEDGVLPDWFLKPHPTYGTTYRLLILITAMQVGVILFSQGDMIVLGEAYAFGVVWSFTFKALAMVVLRFKDPRPREYRVPFNVTVGKTEVPVGLLLIFLVLLTTAVLNLFTKPVATIGGLGFAAAFFAIFLFSERHHELRKRGEKHKHLEQFNQVSAPDVSLQSLNLTKPYRKLVAIRSTQNLYMLEKALSDTDPNITDVVVMTAKSMPKGEANMDPGRLDSYDQALMTAVVERAEALGKQVRPLLVPTNNPVYALLRTAKDLHVQELVIGASNKFTADEQLDQISLLWINLHEGNTAPLTVRILSKDRDLHFDLGGGNRIPRAGESKARSIAELRKAGVGADRVLLVQHDSRSGLDVFESILTTLDPAVELKILVLPPDDNAPGADVLHAIVDQARQVGRKVAVQTLNGQPGPDIVQQAKDGGFDLIVVPLPDEMDRGKQLALPDWIQFVLQNARCRVLLAASPVLPTDLAE